MDRAGVEQLRELLSATPWSRRTREFGAAVRRSRTTTAARPGGLLVVGTPEDEPWHLTAHLQDEAEWSSIPGLAPTLVRWSPPADAPAHLSAGLRRLEAATRGESLLVVAPSAPTEPLLDRVEDARGRGATVFAIAAELSPLDQLAHEALSTADPQAPVALDAVQHLVAVATGEPGAVRRGWRRQVADLLDRVAGAPSR